MRLRTFASRHRQAALLLVALALGTLAAVGARGYIAGQIRIERERLAPAQRTVALVVAKRDLARGEAVDAETMAVRSLPEAYAPSGAVTPERFGALIGGTLAQPLRAGDPLLAVSVVRADASAFSSRVKEGIRAMTITVDEVNSISGMLQPGDRIDLLLSARLPAGGAQLLPREVSRPLMQDLVVLATGRKVRQEQGEAGRAYTSITVEVLPEQAQKLAVAQRVGRLTALLRNPGDRALAPQRPIDVYGLLGIQPDSPAAPTRAGAELIVGGVGGLRRTEPSQPERVNP